LSSILEPPPSNIANRSSSTDTSLGDSWHDQSLTLSFYKKGDWFHVSWVVSMDKI